MASEMQLTLLASLLRRGRNLDLLSSALSLLALGYGLAPLLGAPGSPLAGVLCSALVILGLVQKYWAMRVALDAELFSYLAEDATCLSQRTDGLDQALASLGLQTNAAMSRGWDARSHGALRLLRLQCTWLLIQLLLALAIILGMPWFSLAG